MPVPPELHNLIERFSRNLDQYKRSAYNETLVRVDYIDPMFELLGWDMHNRHGYAEQYREVVHEDKLKIAKSTKAPDYSFRIGGARKFFLEAKKPSVDLKTDVAPTYQVRRYAWSAGLPLSILTDFEEFAVYDCRIEPHRHDKPATARLMYFNFEQYADKWEEIADVFAKESILRGSFDRYAEATKKKRGTLEVDDAFLAEIESWREMLAKNIALRNMEINTRELNQAVQATIDRIIFLRIAEDRGAEQYGQLQALQNGANVYRRLVDIYRHADRRYNSGLFHFDNEKGRGGSPDDWTTELAIDDKPLKEIFRRLYYPESPYEFSVLPGSILGQVYEQFLGKVIRLTSGHQAKVEEKPEVRKAGGVFYTPDYIARYIVMNTVGKQVEGKTPKAVSDLRVLDPACGSGSFLLTAYDFLLDWHLEWYNNNDPEKHARAKNPPIYRTVSPDPETPPSWKLTTREKKRVLLNNIYGVDIDAQAVEVTKLSLLLRVLEDENEQTINVQTSFAERILPDLEANIKCGNSLIGPDFYQNVQTSAFNEEALHRINVFDWDAEFPEIIKMGGFHAVIGNPPYVLLQTLNDQQIFDYLARRFNSATYKIDTYQVFIEKGVELLAADGYLGYITPNTYLRNKYAVTLREILLSKSDIQILRVFYYPVFKGASVDTAIIVVKKVQDPQPSNLIQIYKSLTPHNEQSAAILQSKWTQHPSLSFSLPGTEGSDAIVDRLQSGAILLGDFATAYFGIQTFDRGEFVSSVHKDSGWKPVIDGKNISRYKFDPPSEYVDFRPEAIKSGGNQLVYEQTRIGIRQIGASPIGTIVPKGIYTLNTVYNVFFTRETIYKIEFVLAILSSSLMRWYWRLMFYDEKRTFPKIKKRALLEVPLPNIGKDMTRQINLITLVEAMLDLNRRLVATRSAHDKNLLQRQIEATDRQIDRLVYELYELSEEEIAVVERG